MGEGNSSAVKVKTGEGRGASFLGDKGGIWQERICKIRKILSYLKEIIISISYIIHAEDTFLKKESQTDPHVIVLQHEG